MKKTTVSGVHFGVTVATMPGVVPVIPDYVNTVPASVEATYPGDEEIERRIRAAIRWNAAVMVHRAQRAGSCGRLSAQAVTATLYEVGFQHFWRGAARGRSDHLFAQGSAAPSIYARAYLEGRLTAEQLDGFCRSLLAYPSPRSMPQFWQFPTVSTGLGPLNAIYQARVDRYLAARGIKDTAGQRVWAFLNDDDVDDPKTRAALPLAGAERLGNLVFVVTCKVRPVDRPASGGGTVVQELESTFRSAGWNVVKCLWGRGWDPLLAPTTDGALGPTLNTTPDSDGQPWSHYLGGHDPLTVYAAYAAACLETDQPTVVLAKTVKSYGPGSVESANADCVPLTGAQLRNFRDQLELPIPDSALAADAPPYFRPGRDSEELRYLIDRRAALEGFLPWRCAEAKPLPLPDVRALTPAVAGGQPTAMTTAFVRLLASLANDPDLGPRLAPVVSNEAATRGLDPLLSTLGLPAGQILREGLRETGMVAAMVALGTAYATHGEHLVPVCLLPSTRAFPRSGDSLSALSNQLGRGFLVGSTTRTPLDGESLRHHDAPSRLLASANPACVAYDPGWEFELAHIVRDGLARMYGDGTDGRDQNVFYYLSVYDEPVVQPAEPALLDVAGLLRGIYRYAPAPDSRAPLARILASGSAVPRAVEAQQQLIDRYGLPVELWSVTSWSELRRDALACEAARDARRLPYVTRALASTARGDSWLPVIAVSDWMRELPDQISTWVPGPWTSLGSDGGVADGADSGRSARVGTDTIVSAVRRALAA